MANRENEGEIRFVELLRQIEHCLNQGLYYVAVLASLAIPDIAGAIDSKKGVATDKTYSDWFNKYVKPRYTGNLTLTGAQCYRLRCSMLHQGKTKHDNGKVKVAFTNFPQSNSVVNPFLFLHNDLGLLVEPRAFCNYMIYAAYDWLEVVHDGDCFKTNMEHFMTLYSLSFTDLL